MNPFLDRIVTQGLQREVVEAYDALDAACGTLARRGADNDLFVLVAKAREAAFAARVALDDRFGRLS